METVLSKSGGKQMEWNGNGIKQAEIIQKIFPHFFVYSAAIFEPLNAVRTAPHRRPLHGQYPIKDRNVPHSGVTQRAAANRCTGCSLTTQPATDSSGANGNLMAKE